MIYTNNNKLDDLMALWLVDDDYDYDTRENIISTTTLLKPLRQILLGRANKDLQKQIDISDLVASRIGQAIHSSVEQSLTIGLDKNLSKLGLSKPKILTETRSEKEVNDFIISGKYDIVVNGVVRDIKTTSVWSYIYGSKEKDVKLQMSIYKWLNKKDITADYGLVTYIFTDYSVAKSKQDSQYPKRIEVQKIDLLSLEDTERYILDKLEAIKSFEQLDDLPLCSREDLWREEAKYKVYKDNKAKRASKVCKSDSDAQLYNDTKFSSRGVIKEFKGGVKRCKYCSYTQICTQYEELLLRGEINE